MSFCCLLNWLHTGRCSLNLKVELSSSRETAKLSDTVMLEVMQLADQFCLTELVNAIEVQLSEKIITKIKTSTMEIPAASQQAKLDSQLVQLLEELVG